MREIKFKCWVKSEKYMNESPTANAYTEDLNLNKDVFFNDDLVWLQYTGLKDKNEKEIYDGCIVKDSTGKLWLIYYDAIFIKGCVVAASKEEVCAFFLLHDVLIVGNKFEHPELLEQVNVGD